MNYCIMFDLDGTLIDSSEDLATAVNYMRGEYGLAPLELEQVISYIGNGVKELVRKSIQDSICDFDGALEKMSSYYREHLVDKTCCYPGVKSGLAELAAAIEQGRTPRTSYLQTYHVLEVMTGIMKSAETGVPYEMSTHFEREAPMDPSLPHGIL